MLPIPKGSFVFGLKRLFGLFLLSYLASQTARNLGKVGNKSLHWVLLPELRTNTQKPIRQTLEKHPFSCAQAGPREVQTYC